LKRKNSIGIRSSFKPNKKSVMPKKSTKLSTNKIKDLSMTTNKSLRRGIHGRKNAQIFKLI